MLMPAGLLIVLVLASIAVDMSLVHLRKRQAFEVAAAAANDAAAAGADQGRLRSGSYALDPEVTRAVVDDAVAASELAPHLAAAPVMTVTDEGVRVELAVEADYIFAGIVPGAPERTVISASATATAVPGP
jgi:hypothetical protein